MKKLSELQQKLFHYGPNPESVKAEIKSQYELFINNEWTPPASGRYYETINPATRKTLSRVAHADQNDVDRAVKTAQKAFKIWAALPGERRSRYLYAVARIIQERSRELAIAETLNNGKPIRDSRDIDIPEAARHFFYYAGWADKLNEAFPNAQVAPIGVVGQVIPWNFPLLMAAWKLAPALACGNTVVLKPAESTPITALMLAQICLDAGLPPGVVNIVTGFGDTGSFVVNHPGVRKIAFTGSTEIGKLIRKTTAGSGKKLSLELGGKSPTIVFEDAPLYEAVEGIIDSIFFNQGQVCCAGSRLLIQEPIAEKFTTLLKERMNKIRVGDPMDKNTDMGAINSKAQLDKIKHYVALGEKEGATLWQAPASCPSEGYYFPPTIFTNVEANHAIAREEIFGPVLAIMSFRTPEEAIELANNTPYGLAAGIWTKDVSKMVGVARRLKAGTVWGNGSNKFDAAAEFGGYKESGFGREGGPLGLYEYLNIQYGAAFAGDEILQFKKMDKRLGVKEKSWPRQHLVWKTPKMLIGGKQVRSESGRYYKIFDSTGKNLLANVNWGSRKDIRDAVEAALKALPAWEKTRPYNRGQILYRMAEMLASRADEFAGKIRLQTGVPADSAQKEVVAAIERLLFYCGWADKYVGHVNPITQTDFNISYPEPVGVVALITPNTWPLLGLISKLAPALAAGNTMVLVPSETYPLTATDFIEVLETSDIPSGVINIVTGKHAELAPVLAGHRAVNLIDFSGRTELAKEIEELSIANLKRTYTGAHPTTDWLSPAAQGRHWLRRYMEFKTVWITSGY